MKKKTATKKTARKRAAKKTARKVGRPSKLSQEMVDRVTKLSLLGMTNEQIAGALQVATSTVSKWAAEDAQFSEALKAGREDADGNVVKSLYAKALEGDTTSCIFWLKNRRPQQWRDKVEMQHDGKLEVSINIPNAKK